MSSIMARRAKLSVVDVQIGVSCNKCGKKCPDFEDSTGTRQEFHGFSASGSYSSKFPYDMTLLKFHLCADCLKVFVDSFAIPAEISAPLTDFPIFRVLSSDDKSESWFSYAAVGRDEAAVRTFDGVDESEWDGDWPELGIYRHFKGGLYEVVAGAYDIDHDNERVVVYRHLEGDSQLWFRPLRQWDQQIDLEKVGLGVGQVQRFKRLVLE